MWFLGVSSTIGAKLRNHWEPLVSSSRVQAARHHHRILWCQRLRPRWPVFAARAGGGVPRQPTQTREAGVSGQAKLCSQWLSGHHHHGTASRGRRCLGHHCKKEARRARQQEHAGLCRSGAFLRLQSAAQRFCVFNMSQLVSPYARVCEEVAAATGTSCLNVFALLQQRQRWNGGCHANTDNRRLGARLLTTQSELLHDGLHFSPKGNAAVFSLLKTHIQQHFPHLAPAALLQDYPLWSEIPEERPNQAFAQ